VHPIEIAVALACQGVFPALAGVHPLSLTVFISTWLVWLVEDHCGSDSVWWSQWHWVPFQWGGGSAPHAVHHAPFTTRNYAFVFGFWDHLFGTFVDPDAFHAAEGRRAVGKGE